MYKRAETEEVLASIEATRNLYNTTRTQFPLNEKVITSYGLDLIHLISRARNLGFWENPRVKEIAAEMGIT